MRIITEQEDGTFSMPCIMVAPKRLRAASSALASRILESLSKEPMPAGQLARRLGEPVQKLQYHLTKLREAGILVAERTGGGPAVLRLAAPAIACRFGQWQESTGRTAHGADALAPFIRDGVLDARIVIGSPDPHGPEGARSRDASYAVELGLFLGTFLDHLPKDPVVLDTDLRSWDSNLIIIGGPVVNKAAERVNLHSPLPYLPDARAFRSQKTGEQYGQELVGVIAAFPNPFAKGKRILLLSGKRYGGTRAAILSLIRDPVLSGQRASRVVEGRDEDSDGAVDTAHVLE